MEKTLVNKVANSNIVTINLENFYPNDPISLFDIKDYLFQGLILKEKDFRLALKELDWSIYEESCLCIYCSNDAIIPTWAYMLIASYSEGIAKCIFQGNQEEYLNYFYSKLIEELDLNDYTDQRIIVKGCSNKPVPPGAYSALAFKLKPIARSIMYGEPCSTVPIYKKPRKIT